MYHRLARTERYRWWKPIVEIVLCAVFFAILVIVVVLPASAVLGPDQDGARGLLKVGLEMAITIPAIFLAARVTRRSWRTLLSVDGRVRWGWLGVCLVVALAQVLVRIVVEAAFAAAGHPVTVPRGSWVGWAQFAPLAVVVVATIVPQAASEEFLFRGTLVQAFGAWVRRPWFAILLSSVLFGLAHALPLPGFVSTATLGIAAAWLTIRTGGLEASVALHVLHNVSWFLLDAATGRSDRWVTDMFIDVRWIQTLVDVPLAALYTVAIATLYARRVTDNSATSPVGEP
jgi:membrane protease YdiL (CAAX protease family)